MVVVCEAGFKRQSQRSSKSFISCCNRTKMSFSEGKNTAGVSVLKRKEVELIRQFQTLG